MSLSSIPAFWNFSIKSCLFGFTEMAEKLTGKPEEVEFSDEVVAVVEYRDGSIIDVIKKEA